MGGHKKIYVQNSHVISGTGGGLGQWTILEEDDISAHEWSFLYHVHHQRPRACNHYN